LPERGLTLRAGQFMTVFKPGEKTNSHG